MTYLVTVRHLEESEGEPAMLGLVNWDELVRSAHIQDKDGCFGTFSKVGQDRAKVGYSRGPNYFRDSVTGIDTGPGGVDAAARVAALTKSKRELAEDNPFRELSWPLGLRGKSANPLLLDFLFPQVGGRCQGASQLTPSWLPHCAKVRTHPRVGRLASVRKHHWA